MSVKIVETYRPSGLYVYGSGAARQPKPIAETQGLLLFPFLVLGSGFPFGVSIQAANRTNPTQGEETHRPQAQCPPPFQKARPSTHPWVTTKPIPIR